MKENIEWNGLIFVKFLSVLIMIFVHTFFYLIGDYGVIINSKSFLFQSMNYFQFIGLFIFILPILAGIMYKFSLSKLQFKPILITSLILTLLGIILNTITWGLWYAKSWNILQLIAITYLILYLLEKINWSYFIEIIFLSSIILNPMINYFLAKYNSNYFIGVLIGNNSQLIFWPIFPWISIIIFGYLLGKYYLLSKKNKNKFTLNVTLIGLIGIIISIFLDSLYINIDPNYIWGENMFRVGPIFILSLMSFSLLIIGLSTKLFDKSKFKKYGIINAYSKGILFIYVWQMFVGFKIAKLMKENLNLNYYLNNIFQFESLFIFLFLPLLMILTSWGLGAILIKINQKKIIINLKKKV